MFGFHPFFNINLRARLVLDRWLDLLIFFLFSLEIAFKVRQKDDFFAEFLRVLFHAIRSHNILLIIWLFFYIIKELAMNIHNYFRVIIKQHAAASIRKNIAHTIFLAIIDPLRNI